MGVVSRGGRLQTLSASTPTAIREVATDRREAGLLRDSSCDQNIIETGTTSYRHPDTQGARCSAASSISSPPQGLSLTARRAASARGKVRISPTRSPSAGFVGGPTTSMSAHPHSQAFVGCGRWARYGRVPASATPT